MMVRGRGGWWMGMLAILMLGMVPEPVRAEDPASQIDVMAHIQTAPVARLLEAKEALAKLWSMPVKRDPFFEVIVDILDDISMSMGYVSVLDEVVDDNAMGILGALVSMLEPDACIHNIVLVMGEGVNGEEVPVLLLPLVLNDDSRAAIAALGEVATEWGGVGLDTTLDGGDFIYADIGDGYTAFIPSVVDDISTAITAAREWTRPAPLQDADFRMTFHIERLYARYGSIAQGAENLLVMLEEHAKEEFEIDYAIFPAFRAFLGGFMSLEAQIGEIGVAGRFSTGGASLSFDVTGKAGSDLAALLNFRALNPLPLDLLGRLPSDAHILTVDGSQDALYAQVSERLGAFAEACLGPFHEEGAARLREAIVKGSRAHGPSASAVYAWEGGEADTQAADGNGTAVVTYIRAQDPQAMVEARLEMAAAVDSILDGLFKFIALAEEEPYTGSPIRIVSDMGGMQVAGLPVMRIRANVEVDDDDPDAEEFREFFAMVENMLNASMVIHDGVVISVRGGDEARVMDAAIRALTGADAGLANAPGRMEAFQGQDGDVTNLVSFDLMQLMKWWFRMEINDLPYPERADGLRAILDAIPASPHIMLGGRRLQDGMRVEMQIPASTAIDASLHGSAFWSRFEEVKERQRQEQRDARRGRMGSLGTVPQPLELTPPADTPAEELDPDFNKRVHLSETGESERLPIPSTLELDPEFKKGVRLVQGGEFKEGKQIFLKLLEGNPNDAEGWRWLGDCQYNLMEFEKAIASYQKALKLNPSNYFAKRGEGLGLFHLGNQRWMGEKQEEAHKHYLQSEAILQECIRQYPADMDAMFGLVMVAEGKSRLPFREAIHHLAEGEQEKAEEAFRMCVQIIENGTNAAQIVLVWMEAGNDVAKPALLLHIAANLQERKAVLFDTFNHQAEAVEAIRHAVEFYRRCTELAPDCPRIQEGAKRSGARLLEWTERE